MCGIFNTAQDITAGPQVIDMEKAINIEGTRFEDNTLDAYADITVTSIVSRLLSSIHTVPLPSTAANIRSLTSYIRAHYPVGQVPEKRKLRALCPPPMRGWHLTQVRATNE